MIATTSKSGKTFFLITTGRRNIRSEESTWGWHALAATKAMCTRTRPQRSVMPATRRTISIRGRKASSARPAIVKHPGKPCRSTTTRPASPCAGNTTSLTVGSVTHHCCLEMPRWTVSDVMQRKMCTSSGSAHNAKPATPPATGSYGTSIMMRELNSSWRAGIKRSIATTAITSR